MTDEERAERVRELRHAAKAGRDRALSYGPAWADYERVVGLADEMDAEARALTSSALSGLPRAG